MSKNQEAFEVMVKHLRKQGQLSKDKYGTCCYRGMGGLMCAAGVLISDEVYTPELEQQSILDYGFIKALSKSGWDGVDRQMIRMMQATHDCYDVCQWEGRFVKTADKYGLTLPV